MTLRKFSDKFRRLNKTVTNRQTDRQLATCLHTVQ